MVNYNFEQLLKETYDDLSARGLETSRADWLLQDISGMSRTDILMHYKEEVPQPLIDQFLILRERMYDGEPVQYIVGFAEFYGRKFELNKDVLIPRTETEELVFQTLSTITKQNSVLCDIGTGSGAIAISLKKEMPTLDVIATDISNEALVVAKSNANLHKADIHFMQGDALQPLIDKGIKVDVLVSNPPYISYEEQIQMTDTVLNYEPHLALFAEDDGLYIYKSLLAKLDQVMDTGGLVIFEIGHLQGDVLKTFIAQHYRVDGLKIITDINQKNRMIQFNWISE
ncbi:peptide chain release factor N(5)-glutamine methyltransferase [Mammaliicoccus stepanovicii]|uniref:Release factor glutamine methyltransferase n=1 Tax=Mammaliicoccus stepanovicii TaxID=643214 RepID=A0A239YPV7_9STAP|nr:peptide chain release factor N(5)-glutamine methyltransferase [Mammaliicoccus stepanovicii]PNZ78914.1 peptide chain release factor N(5)-glutamine methyltransferase [Mammaliicoccus stepanovicii]GGI41225.1 release factor glutamine methyltransferase [Mammaliicoccus stepanovicii]SNV60278.1 polypeptide chain release factors methylase [Mammaliicoccus stepanovicii]